MLRKFVSFRTKEFFSPRTFFWEDRRQKILKLCSSFFSFCSLYSVYDWHAAWHSASSCSTNWLLPLIASVLSSESCFTFASQFELSWETTTLPNGIYRLEILPCLAARWMPQIYYYCIPKSIKRVSKKRSRGFPENGELLSPTSARLRGGNNSTGHQERMWIIFLCCQRRNGKKSIRDRHWWLLQAENYRGNHASS